MGRSGPVRFLTSLFGLPRGRGLIGALRMVRGRFLLVRFRGFRLFWKPAAQLMELRSKLGELTLNLVPRLTDVGDFTCEGIESLLQRLQPPKGAVKAFPEFFDLSRELFQAAVDAL